MRLDADALTAVVRAALPDATPDVVASVLLEQIPHVDPATGASLVDRVTAGLPASTWMFEDQRLDRWPEPVGDRAMFHVRALPSGKDRVLALCHAAKRLTLAERREAFDGVLDRTLSQTTFEYGKPISYSRTIEYLVRTLPADWQEEWIRSKRPDDGVLDVFREYRARRGIDRLTEAAMRDLWARIDHASTSRGGVPEGYFGLAPHLPEDLRQQALARIRACASQSTRLYHLVGFDEELTAAERIELVEVPWNPHDPVMHLERVRKHLPRVPVELRRKWLEVALSLGEGADQRGLMALLSCLSGEDYRRAADALVATVIRDGGFFTVERRLDLLPDDALAPLLLRLVDDPYGWRRDELIAHVIADRNAELADRCLCPLVDALAELEPDACLELVAAMTPWLADRSQAAVPRSLAELPIPSPGRPANPQYFIARVLEADD